MQPTVRPLELGRVPLRGVHLIEASAGTGKTYTIASLYLRMLLECGWRVQQILVVTFTKAATAELRGRIRDRIRTALEILEASSTPMETPPTPDRLLVEWLHPYRDNLEARQRLRDALICMDEAAIFTIHSVCQRLLQEHAFESGVLFETEFVSNQGDLLNAVIEDFWRRTFYRASSGLARLAQRTWGTPYALLQEIVQELAREDVELVPQVAEADVAPEVYRQRLESLRIVWRDRRMAIVDGLGSLLASRNLSRAEDNYHPMALAAADAALTACLGGVVDDYFLPDGFGLFTRGKFDASLTKQGIKTGVQPPVPEFFDLCQQLQELCRNKLIHLRAAAFRYCREALVELKNSRKLLSYDDLIRRLHESLRSESGKKLAEAIAGQFPVALIDEFQDTDPGQYAIFRTVYRDRPECGLFMIGDPKQAIYSFRGGDIFTYMRARRATESQFTLDTNWRSTAPYLRAVNRLFSQRRQPFVYSADIPYHDVNAAAECRASREPLTVAGKAPAPFCAWFVQRTPDNTHHNAVTKDWARKAIAGASAGEIEYLLDSRNQVRIGSRAVAPRDIAVLVRTHREGAIIQQALQERGIASVYSGRSSIHASPEAAELGRILFAVAEPQNDRALRSALATDILGKTAEWLAADDDEQWDQVFQYFRAYHDDWQRRGFIAMFRRLLDEQGVPERLMQYADGERRLTNVLHLGELLQAASQQQPGMEGLLRWFADARLRPDEDSDEQQLRLESDAERVQIVTLHKSKGLEYDIVLLPFCWDSKPKDAKRPFSFHHEEGPETRRVFDLAAQAENLPRADRERLAEELRLLYVGATRARYRCYIAWGHINGAKNSGLGYLLHQQQSMSDAVSEVSGYIAGATDAVLLSDLLTLQGIDGLFEVTALPAQELPSVDSTAAAPAVLAARCFTGAIDASWRIASFTGLAAAHRQAPGPMEPDYDSASSIEGVVVEEPAPAPNSIFAFPKGARAGIFLHELFERLEFPSAFGPELSDTISRLLGKHAYPIDDWHATVTTLVGQVLDTVLDSDTGLCLRAISGARRLNELKFYFPLRTLRAVGLNEVLAHFGAYADDPPGFDFDETRGMMLGFIDLVFEDRGRYYLLDYKSNHLGNRIEDYAPERLLAVMRSHRYDLQYLLYTVAVHRYLRHRLPGYCYREHFGGVYYLFLRGMDARRGAAFGVHATKPEQALIEQLDTLFGGDCR